MDTNLIQLTELMTRLIQKTTTISDRDILIFEDLSCVERTVLLEEANKLVYQGKAALIEGSDYSFSFEENEFEEKAEMLLNKAIEDIRLRKVRYEEIQKVRYEEIQNKQGCGIDEDEEDLTQVVPFSTDIY